MDAEERQELISIRNQRAKTREAATRTIIEALNAKDASLEAMDETCATLWESVDQLNDTIRAQKDEIKQLKSQLDRAREAVTEEENYQNRKLKIITAALANRKREVAP